MGCLGHKEKTYNTSGNTLNVTGPENDKYNMSIKSQYQISILGESKVGKTSILNTYFEVPFDINIQSSIGLNRNTKTITVINQNNETEKVKFIFVDPSGQERYRAVAGSIIKSADGVLVVFDLTDEDSFEKVSYWIEQVRNLRPNIPIILIGNKSDLVEERKVTQEKIDEKKEKYNLDYMQTSALSGENINESFQTICQRAFDSYREQPHEI